MRLGLRLSLAAFVLLLASCTRTTRVATPPPPPPPAPTVALLAANREFAARNCSDAKRDFEEYLDLVPSAGDRDRALFYLAIIHTVPECGREDWATAEAYMKRLFAEFPESSYRSPAHLILSLRDESAKISTEISRLTAEQAELRNEGIRLRNEIATLQNDTAQLRMSSSQLNEEINRLKTEAEQVAEQLKNKDQRIRQLTTELDRLNRIDSERRARP